jgi:hypothetical protein
MADLLDIAASTAVRAVWINGNRITVRGLNANDIAFIVSRFPDIKNLFSGGEFNQAALAPLIIQLGAAVGPVIAAGCGRLGDEQHEHAAATLAMPEQEMLFDPIWTLTFPNGIRSFAEKMARTFAGEGAKKTVKMRLKQSPSASRPLSDAASRPTMQ